MVSQTFSSFSIVSISSSAGVFGFCWEKKEKKYLWSIGNLKYFTFSGEWKPNNSFQEHSRDRSIVFWSLEPMNKQWWITSEICLLEIILLKIRAARRPEIIVKATPLILYHKKEIEYSGKNMLDLNETCCTQRIIR